MNVWPISKLDVTLIAFVLAVMLCLPAQVVTARELQVSPDGPLYSIEAARDLVRAHQDQGQWVNEAISVIVHDGIYAMAEPIRFTPSDARSPGSEVTYRAADNANPIISGGRPITGWQTIDVKGKTAWSVDIPEVKEGKWYFRQLFINGQRRPRPRLPREGFYELAGLPDITDKTPWSKGQTKASFRPGELKNWKNLNDVEVVALHFWIESRLPIASVDESASTATFSRESTFRLTDAHHPKQFARYYVENVFEAMDEPGEWYLDRSAGRLYYIPLPGETPENVTVIAPRLTQLIQITGDPEKNRPVSGIAFDGLAFEHADWALPAADAGSVQAAFEVPGMITLTNAENCSFNRCTIAHTSTYGIEFASGCRNNRITGCVLKDLGAGGVKLNHGSSHSTVTDCEIGPGGLQFHSAVGVWIGASGDNVVTHNHIHHLFYTGVSVGWSWGYKPSPAVRNTIEYNHIHDIGQGLLSDMGGIYTLGVSPGTRLRYNLIHDIEAHTYGGWGLYTDEGSTDILLENNIVYRTKHSGFHQHYGSYNIIRNNIFAFGRHAQMMRTRNEPHTSFVFEHNIVYFDIPTLLGSNWTDDNYRIDYNLYYRKGNEPIDFAGGSFEDWKKRGHDRYSMIADPMFVDPEKGDFSLQPESPALKLGFKPIDTSQIGPRKKQ